MSKIKINIISTLDGNVCKVTFTNGSKTTIVNWEREALRNNSRLFLLVLLLFYNNKNKIHGGMNYYSIVIFIGKI